MIKIENIVVSGNIVRAEVTIISWIDESFEIAVNVETEEIIENTRVILDSYVYMAKTKLIESYNENQGKLPKILEVVWY